MVQAKPTTPIWNTADPLYTNVICALPFNMPSDAGTTAHDLSPNGLNATLVGGASFFNDPTLGGVIALDGTSGYLALSNLLNAAVLATPNVGACSISMWLKLNVQPPTVSTKDGLMDFGSLNSAGTASKWPSATPSAGGETAGNGYVNVFRNISDTRFSVGSLAGTVLTNWHHVVITNQAGGNWKLYINGALFFTGTASNPLTMSLAPVLGRSTETGGAGPFYLNGDLGDFRVYNLELNAAQVLGLFNSPWNLYTVTVPLVQGRLESIMADIAPGRDDYAERELALMVDSVPNRSSFATKAAMLMVDAVPFKDPIQTNTPPNNPGALPLNGTNAINPSLKPDNSPTPALNGDPITTSIALAMPFTEGSGGPNDRSGNGNNGTLNGNIAWSSEPLPIPPGFRTRLGAASSVLQAIGGAANVNYVNVPSSSSLQPTAVTIAVWFRPNGVQTTGAILAAKRTTGSNIAYGLTIDTSNGTGFRFAMTDNIDNVTEAIQATGFISAGVNAPFLVVGTYDGSLQSLYVNGKLVAQVGQTGSIVYDGTTALRLLGDTSGGGASSPNGWLEDAKIWGRALSAAEIAQLFSTQYLGFNTGSPFSAGSGIYGPYCSGAVCDILALMVDAVPQRANPSAELIALMVDAVPVRSDAAARLVAVMVDATPAIQNVALLGIGAIFPNTGSNQGGTPVTIKGFNFINVTAVFVGGVACTSVVVVDQTTITAVTGAHISGLVDVRVDSSTFGTTIAQNLYQYVGGLGSGSQALLRGKELTTSFWNQDPPNSFYTGMTAPTGTNTTLPFTLTDNPTTPSAVEVYVRHSSDTGYGRMRYGVDFNVDIANKHIIWLGNTALFGLVSSDEMIVCYPGQH